MAGLFNTDLAELQAKIRGENVAERNAFLQGASPSSLFAPVVQGAYGLIQQTRDTLSPDPRMRKAQALEAIKQEASKTTQPGTAEHYKKLAELSQAQGFADAAEYAALKAQELETAQYTKQIAQQGEMLKMEKTALEIQEKYQNLTKRPTQVVNVDGKQRIIDTQTGDVVAELGNAPASGTKISVNVGGNMSSLEDLNRAETLRKSVFGNTLDRVQSIKDVENTLQQLVGSNYQDPNGVALPTLQRQMVKMVGDSQIAKSEADNVLGSLGFVGDFQNFVSTFATGVPTQEKMLKIAQFVRAYQDSIYEEHDKKAEKFNKILDTTNSIADSSRDVLKVEPIGRANRPKQGKAQTKSGTSYEIIED